MSDSIKLQNLDIAIRGMHCRSCEGRVGKALSNLPGVRDVVVSFNDQNAKLKVDKEIDSDTLKHALSIAGDYQLVEIVSGAKGGFGETTSGGKRPVIENDSVQAVVGIGCAVGPAASRPKNDPARTPTDRNWWATYRPLLTIVAYLMLGTIVAGISAGTWDMMFLMRIFMGLFFVVFSFFKMLNLIGFAQAYASYDLISAKIFRWGYVYPFVELGLGIAYLIPLNLTTTNWVAFVVMTIGTVGVVNAVARGREIQCGCLGTMFDLPMSTVTIVEDVTMVAMAAWMLFWPLV